MDQSVILTSAILFQNKDHNRLKTISEIRPILHQPWLPVVLLPQVPLFCDESTVLCITGLPARHFKIICM